MGAWIKVCEGLIMTDKLLDSPFYLLSVSAWESMEEFPNS